MYLTRDAMRATLAGLAARSASGSTLIVNYHTLHRRFLARRGKGKVERGAYMRIAIAQR